MRRSFLKNELDIFIRHFLSYFAIKIFIWRITKIQQYGDILKKKNAYVYLWVNCFTGIELMKSVLIRIYQLSENLKCK